MFLIPMKPIRTVAGLIAYTSSEDEDVIVPAVIDETRHRVKDDYKITLKSLYPQFGHVDFYISDLGNLLRHNSHQMFEKNNIF